MTRTWGRSFEWGGAWVKIPRINAFSRNVNSTNLKIFPTHGGIFKFERKFNKHSGEREREREREIKSQGVILEANVEGQGWSSRLFTVLLILTWELRYSQKRWVNRKRVGEFWKLFCLRDGANELPWERKELPGARG